MSSSSDVGASSGLVAPNHTGSPSASNSIATYNISIFNGIIWLFHWILVEKTYSLWSFIHKILTGKIHIAISLSTILVLFATITGLVWMLIRYRYLNVYEKLSSEPYDSARQQKTYIDTRDEESKSGFSSYLEEFLSAIKIFGYLDRPVFHELTRSMKTQRLDAGELFALDSSLGFSIVVEGSVNVYSKVDGDNKLRTANFASSKDTYILNGERFQLINYVKTGNPLSSLVSILSLFTEYYSPSLSANSSEQVIFKVMDTFQSKSDAVNSLQIFPDYLVDNAGVLDGENLRELSQSPSSEHSDSNKSILPELIARANTDCTVAIIPADSFKRLTRKWPRAASHIVQVVLTRLYRVTFQTANNYFGLTNEIFQTEIKLNQETDCQLPRYLCDSVIRRMNDQIADAKSSPHAPLTSPVSNLHNNKSRVSLNKRSSFSTPSDPKTANSSVILNRKASKEEFLAGSVSSLKKPTLKSSDTHSRHVVLDSRDKHHPGDLLSNVPISRTGIFDPSFHQNLELRTKTFSAEEETEDTALRIALAENLFKFLGIDEKSINSPILRTSSSSSLLNYAKKSNRMPLSPLEEFPNQVSSTLAKPKPVPFKLDVISSESSRRNSISMVNEEQQALDFDQAKNEFAEGIKFLYFEQGATIVEQNSPNDGLYYVVAGALAVSHSETNFNHENIEQHLYTANPGSITGYLASLVGHKSLVTIKAKTNTYVGFLPQDTIDKLCEKFFTIHLSIAKKLTEVMDKDLLDMDFAVEWVQAKAGHAIYKQDMDATGIYVVLSGRFRELKETNDGIETLGEYGQGSSLGELEVLTASRRKSSLVAVRESEAARIPRHLFEFLALKNPSIMIKISRLVAQKMASQSQVGTATLEPSSAINTTARPFFTNYKTITILPTKYGLPVSEFAEKLVGEFKRMKKSVISLNQASTLSHLGRHAFDKLAKLKQSGYFSDLEERYQLIVYVTDTPVNSNWTHTCISQGDCVLLLADASSDPAVGEYERLLLKVNTSARTELVLLHPDRFVNPGSTSIWLKNRLWVEAHHHIQFHVFRSGGYVNSSASRTNIIPALFLSNLKSKVETLRQDIVGRYKDIGGKRYYTPVDMHKNDFARLARIISGQAIGLVLGGGGARGIAHIGVIQALEKEGIPIDLIGGTSIGSFVGGLYAKEYDIVPIYGRAKKFSGRVASIWRTLSDLTYPLVAYTTGHEFNRGVWKAFGDSRIEDFWIRYFCNSTNITNSVMEFHTSGYAWRFIRASMSLCGLVPPVVDHGNMLLDGGYVDNLPVTEMKRQGASIIFAVDVGSVDDRTPMKYGDTLSGFLELINRYNPFSKTPAVPSMADIQLRLAYVGSVVALERAKAMPGVIYMRPPIENFGTLAFGKFTEIYNVGQVYGSETLAKLREEGKLPENLEQIQPIKSSSAFPLQRRNSI